jgi:hypothetical protein
MAIGLFQSTSVKSMIVQSFDSRASFDALTAALSSNTTLQHLELSARRSDNGHDLSPVFVALGKNTWLKTLTFNSFGSMDESLCTAMKDGLEMNESLESLELHCVCPTNDNYDLWCKAFSFLHTNKVLKSLTVTLHKAGLEFCFPALHSGIAAMLQENASLENLSVRLACYGFKSQEYITLVTALQHNTTLKSLKFYDYGEPFQLTDDEDKQIAKLLKKNYSLENLPEIDTGIRVGDAGAILQSLSSDPDRKNWVGDAGAILRLNAAGRRYLIEDGSSVSKGVKVLITVCSDINCVFLHLLENPTLCDRSVVESASDTSPDNGGSTSPVNHIGKREHDQALDEGKASRRRRT